MGQIRKEHLKFNARGKKEKEDNVTRYQI